MSMFDTYTSSLITQARRAEKLTREAEVRLIQRWQSARDHAAADRLVRSNLRHVVFLALKYKRYGVPVEELIAEGNMGLVRAMDKFDADQGTRFATYAGYWIRSFIVSAIMRSWSLVGGGSGALNTRTFFRLRRERAKATSLHGHGDAADHAVALALGLTKEQVSEMLQRLDHRDVSLDAPTFGDAATTLLDGMTDGEVHSERVESEDRVAHLSGFLGDALGELSEREQFIIERRIMADPEDELSLSELGRHFGVSRERIRQLEERAKDKLRTHVLRNSRTERRPHEIRPVAA